MKRILALAACVLMTVLAGISFSGCESAGGGDVHGSMYYGAGFYDPWYYGHYYDDPDLIVTPPPSRPEPPARPTHPIARPTPRPMPTIPRVPRPALR